MASCFFYKDDKIIQCRNNCVFNKQKWTSSSKKKKKKEKKKNEVEFLPHNHMPYKHTKKFKMDHRPKPKG